MTDLPIKTTRQSLYLSETTKIHRHFRIGSLTPQLDFKMNISCSELLFRTGGFLRESKRFLVDFVKRKRNMIKIFFLIFRIPNVLSFPQQSSVRLARRRENKS